MYVVIQALDGHCGFPKGHMEAGETEADTAIREVWEETGLHIQLLPGFRTVEEYTLPEKPDVRKQVVYFLAEFDCQTLRHQETELIGAYLLSYEEALEMLTHEAGKRILREADAFLRSRR